MSILLEYEEDLLDVYKKTTQKLNVHLFEVLLQINSNPEIINFSWSYLNDSLFFDMNTIYGHVEFYSNFLISNIENNIISVEVNSENNIDIELNTHTFELLIDVSDTLIELENTTNKSNMRILLEEHLNNKNNKWH